MVKKQGKLDVIACDVTSEANGALHEPKQQDISDLSEVSDWFVDKEDIYQRQPQKILVAPDSHWIRLLRAMFHVMSLQLHLEVRLWQRPKHANRGRATIDNRDDNMLLW